MCVPSPMRDAGADDAVAQPAVARRSGARGARPRARSSCRAPTVTSGPSTTRLPTRAPAAIRQPALDQRRRDDPALGLDVVGHGEVARRPAGRRPRCRRCPRGCRTSPGGSAPASRCRASSPRRRSRTGPSPTSRGNTSRSNETVASGAISVEHVALEHVGAGVDQVRVDLVGLRLLEELLDRAVVVDAHEAVGGRVLDRRSAPACRGAPVASCCATARSGRSRSARRR